VTFSPVHRPKLRIGASIHEVIDASSTGLRIRHTTLKRPAVGTRVSGRLSWPATATPLVVRGTMIRVEATEVALACDGGVLPISLLLSETARRRDLAEPETPETD
jgi:hypothetical protein